MRLTRAFLAAAAALVVAALTTVPAAAQTDPTFPAIEIPSGVEHIASYDVHIVVAEDGTLTTTETIVYQFGDTPRHGIIRNLVRSELYGNDSDYDRLYKIDVTSVTADGQPVQFDEYDDGHFRNVKIGDPDVEITGEHTY